MAQLSASAEIFIQLHQVSLTLAQGRCLLQPTNFTFHAARYAIIGPNGAGKSLLGQLLMGLHPVSGGRLERRGIWYYVEQHPDVSARVSDLLGVTPLLQAMRRVEQGEAQENDIDLLEGNWQLYERIAQALEDAGLPGLSPDSPVERLSGGERTRIALSGAFHSGADGLLLDEPSNHLDAPARQWLLERLARWPGQAIVISHDRTLLEQIPLTVALQEGRLTLHGGNYDSYCQALQQQQEAVGARLAHLRAERKRTTRELATAHDAQQRRQAKNRRQGAAANLDGLTKGRRKDGAQAYDGRENQRRSEQQNTLAQAIRETASRLLPEHGVMLTLPQSHVARTRRVFACEDLRLPHQPPTQPPLELCLTGPVRVGITGANGTGKSTLLKIIAGQLAPAKGHCTTGVRCAWIDQDARLPLPDDLSLLQMLAAGRSPLTESELRTRLACLGLDADTVTRPVSGYSGGERLKAALAWALWRAEPAQLLLLDEPGNHLDLMATEALERALTDYPGALMVVSHDARFLQALALTHRLHAGPAGWCLETLDDTENA